MDKQFEFSIGDLLPIAITFVVVGVAITYGINVVSDIRSGFAITTTEYNASNETMTALAKIPTKLPMLATIVIAAVVIGVLLRYFMNRS